MEPDFDAWKEYAISHGVHPAVLTYLEIKTGDFYVVETTVDGKRFVTARGWVDLSDMMKLYEQKDYKVNEQLVRQYLQNEKIAKSFAVYYDLFRKYRSDYQVDDILAGKATKKIEDRATKAKFDERLSLLGLLLDAVGSEFKAVAITEGMMTNLMNDIRAMRVQLGRVDAAGAADLLEKQAAKLESAAQAGRRANSMSEDAARASRRAAVVMTEMAREVRGSDAATGMEAFHIIKKCFDDENAKLKKSAEATRKKLDSMFAFCEKVFPEGQELLILVTELTLNPATARFIGKYGCDAYFRNNKNLLFYERQTEIIRSIDELNLDD